MDKVPSIQDWRDTFGTLAIRFADMWTKRYDEHGVVSEIETQERIDLVSGIDSSHVNVGYSSIKFFLRKHDGYRADNIKFAEYSPTQRKIVIALWYEIRTILHNDSVGASLDFDGLAFNISINPGHGDIREREGYKEHTLYKLMKAFSEITISKDALKFAISEEKAWANNHSANEKKNAKNGIAQVLTEARPKVGNEAIIEAQMEQLGTQIKNGLAARTWGFEIEVPDCKGVKAPNGIEKGDDGSLRSENGVENCECDCDDCYYHECDCEHCETGSSDPDHCGNDSCSSAESAEYRTTGGIQRMVHAGMNKLCADLNEENAEMNDSAGTHIHVFAADLNMQQIGHVLASYVWLSDILSVVAGRRNVNYARDFAPEHVQQALRRNNASLYLEKPRSMNMIPLFSTRGTIEFRQMDCNLNAERITLWAWLVRGLVTAAKRGAKLGAYRKVTDLQGIVDVLAKYNVFLDNETPENIVYGSKTDEELFDRSLLVRS